MSFEAIAEARAEYERAKSDPKCECFPTPPEMWTTHYGAVEPGSAIEFNPECPAHGGPNFGPIVGGST